MNILLITDIHYGEDTNYKRVGGEEYINSYGSSFESFLPSLHEAISSHDLVINLGDLIHETDTETDVVVYKKALALLGSTVPVKSVIGNHDLNTLSREQLTVLTGEEKLYYSFDLNGYHHVVLDGFRETKADPHRIEEEQLEWLKHDLQITTLSTLVYCHYPLDDQNLDSNYYFKDVPEKAVLFNRVEVRSIFEASGKVRCVFSGHLHFFNTEEIHGITYITVPAFTENDGSHRPKAECLSVHIEGDTLTTEVLKIVHS